MLALFVWSYFFSFLCSSFPFSFSTHHWGAVRGNEEIKASWKAKEAGRGESERILFCTNKLVNDQTLSPVNLNYSIICLWMFFSILCLWTVCIAQFLSFYFLGVALIFSFVFCLGAPSVAIIPKSNMLWWRKEVWEKFLGRMDELVPLQGYIHIHNDLSVQRLEEGIRKMERGRGINCTTGQG